MRHRDRPATTARHGKRSAASGTTPREREGRPAPRQRAGAQRAASAATWASLRRMQNSLPSGSARTTQPPPSGVRRSATWVAPSASRRSTSSSRDPSVGRRSRWTRFFSCLSSGTSTNRTCPRLSAGVVASAGGTIMHSSWPGRFGSPGTSVYPRTWAQKTDCA
ncbi:hypothetical protein DBB34_15455 [Sphaerisporangium cinnabarinum]|nr:hypothetical protein DBB34_15455 [Sphaerisporangium cinnabarinum]